LLAPDEYLRNASHYLNIGQAETARVYNAKRPNGPTTADMTMATLLLRVAELNAKMYELMKARGSVKT